MKLRHKSSQTGLDSGRFSTGAGCCCFQIMLEFWLFCLLFCDTLGGPVQRAEWLEGVNPVKAIEDEASPSFYHMPMFQHTPDPLVASEQFRPVSHKKPLPAGLTVLLLPPTRHNQIVPETGGRAVEVYCGIDKISVRVDRLQLRIWTLPSLFRLGSCEASRISPRFLYFHYRLTECNGESKVGIPYQLQISLQKTYHLHVELYRFCYADRDRIVRTMLF